MEKWVSLVRVRILDWSVALPYRLRSEESKPLNKKSTADIDLKRKRKRKRGLGGFPLVMTGRRKLCTVSGYRYV